MRMPLAAVLFATALPLTTAFAQSPNGAALYQQTGCVACHGADGASPTAPGYPKLAGQSAQYLLTQMRDIKSGARSNGMTAMMKPVITQVSEQDMEAIAGWLSQQSCTGSAAATGG